MRKAAVIAGILIGCMGNPSQKPERAAVDKPAAETLALIAELRHEGNALRISLNNDDQELATLLYQAADEIERLQCLNQKQ